MTPVYLVFIILFGMIANYWIEKSKDPLSWRRRARQKMPATIRKAHGQTRFYSSQSSRYPVITINGKPTRYREIYDKNNKQKGLVILRSNCVLAIYREENKYYTETFKDFNSAIVWVDKKILGMQ